MLTEVVGDGRVVWVNSARSGFVGSLARFGQYHVDIHHVPSMKTIGQPECPECLECWDGSGESGRVTLEDWWRFVRRMRDLHEVVVGDDVMPTRLRRKQMRERETF